VWSPTYVGRATRQDSACLSTLSTYVTRNVAYRGRLYEDGRFRWFIILEVLTVVNVIIQCVTSPVEMHPRLGVSKSVVESSWNVMAHGDTRVEKWRGNWRMEWVASSLDTTSEHGVSSITTADAHNSAASSRLNWRPCRFKWTRPFRRKTIYGFCACAITFQTQSTRLTCGSISVSVLRYFGLFLASADRLAFRLTTPRPRLFL